MTKKRVFSGIQPSGDLHIGNYLGAIHQWVKLQDERENIFCIVDEHAITVPQNPTDLHRRIIEVAKTYIAAGINPEKSAIFVQSSRPEHAELGWILNNYTYMGELSRMTQYKDKSKLQNNLELMIDDLNYLVYLVEKNNGLNSIEWIKSRKDYYSAAVRDVLRSVTYRLLLREIPFSGIDFQIFNDKYLVPINKAIDDGNKPEVVKQSREFVKLLKELGDNKFNVSVGLFDYPILMAADILLYDTDEVPVGDDQKQHVEICRDIAGRVNKRYGKKLLQIPEFTTNKEATRIMSLTDPTVKMSKSDMNPRSRIELLDTAETIHKKIASATTDSDNEIKFDRVNKPGISNLLNILAACKNTSPKELQEQYSGISYGEFKKDVAEAVIAVLEPFQARYNELSDEYVLEVLREGAEKVAPQAQKTLQRVKDAIGLGI